jgi:hypothetical protein
MDSIVRAHLDEAFDQIENSRGDMPPTEVMKYLETSWGFGDLWAEWWQSYDTEGWE